MAITFPRSLPTRRFRPGSIVTLERQLVAAPTRGGIVQVAELGTPLWRAKYQTVPMLESDGRNWEAWLDSLRGGAKFFYALHPFRRFGQAYPNGYTGMTKHTGGAFGGVGLLDAVGVARDTITISGLPTSLVITVGDLVSMTLSGTRRSMHRVMETVTASAGVATVTVEPTVLAGEVVGGNVFLIDPFFLAAVEQKSVRVEWGIGARCVVSFEAWQTFAAG